MQAEDEQGNGTRRRQKPFGVAERSTGYPSVKAGVRVKTGRKSFAYTKVARAKAFGRISPNPFIAWQLFPHCDVHSRDRELLAYLARYTHRVAISNSRLVTLDEAGVTFKWKDYRIKGRDRLRTMTLDVAEFIRRFLLHVLRRCHVAMRKARGVYALRIFKPPRRPRATWSSPRRVARGEIELTSDGVGR